MTRWLNLHLLNTLLALSLASLIAAAQDSPPPPGARCPMFSMGLRITTSTCPSISSPVVWRKTSP